MWCNPSGFLIFAAGAALMIAAVALGYGIQPEVAELGMDAYRARSGAAGSLSFVLFAFGFPLGVGVVAIGAARGSGTSWPRLAWFAALVMGAVSTAVLVPLVFGRSLGGGFFGAGGILILVLVLATAWFWGADRARMPAGSRTPADLKGGGYVCFAMAAWNLCGVGDMPSFALSPETMLAVGSQPFAVGQMKAIMALLVIGWALTAIGHRLALDTGGGRGHG
jgi:hypothetical protein